MEKKGKKVLIVLLITSIVFGLTSCSKKEWDDELVITWLSKEMSSSDKEYFLADYGINERKDSWFRFEEFLKNTLNDESFYERNDSRTELWEHYHLLTDNFVDTYCNELCCRGRNENFDDVYYLREKKFDKEYIKRYENILQEYTQTSIEKNYDDCSRLERERFEYWLKKNSNSICSEISNWANQMFLDAYFSKDYERASFILDTVYNIEDTGKYEFPEFYKALIDNYASTEALYLYCKIPENRKWQYACYDLAIKNNEFNPENSKYIEEIKRDYEKLDVIVNSKWGVYWMKNVGYCSDSSLGFNYCILDTANGTNYGIYHISDREAASGAYYIEDDVIKTAFVTYTSLEIKGEIIDKRMEHSYSGTFELSEDKDGTPILIWKGKFVYANWYPASDGKKLLARNSSSGTFEMRFKQKEYKKYM